MQTDSIRKLLAPFLPERELDDAQLEQLAAFLDLLLRWNQKTNLTSIRTAEEIIKRHFGEGFFMASQVCAVAEPATAIDFGSGAGFPGIPLAIYSPKISVTLIESQNKKASFLKEAVRTLQLKNVAIFAGRGETFNGTAELVTFRAVEKFEESSAAAAKLVSANGRFALLITPKQVIAAKSLPGFNWAEPIKVPESQESVLLVGTRMSFGESGE
jgi:16S rRNA (guanine527-N7)-methyltransferase